MTKETKAPTYKLLTGSAAIDKAIASIATRGKKLDNDIQIAALSAMQHHSECGDVTLINRLVSAMPLGSRVNALREYIETFGAVAFDPDSKVFIHAKGKKARITDAMAVTWTAFKPEHDYQPLTDPVKLVAQTMARMEKDMKELGTKSKVTAEMYAAVKSAHATMQASAVLH